MASKPLCKIDGCGKVAYQRGWCNAHYKRWWRYGDPLGGSTPWGAAKTFILQAAVADAEECVIYPFYRTPDGYGWMKTPSGHLGAHVYVAILAHGDKPTPSHEACHSCGNGRLGCVNPKHIYWGTRSDNVKDAYRAGAQMGTRGRYGEDAAATKYSDEIIRQVREALNRGEPGVSISKRLGISNSHISRIKHGARLTD